MEPINQSNNLAYSLMGLHYTQNSLIRQPNALTFSSRLHNCPSKNVLFRSVLVFT